MKIGLIDVDGHNFPNLALMRISSYHKGKGDEVEWWQGNMWYYDIVYMSKVFSNEYSPDVPEPYNCGKICRGGTGYCITTENGREVFDQKKNIPLPDDIEHCRPDYSIYPQYDFAIAMTSRGCPRGCPFCIVGKKEGLCSHKVADVSDFWYGQKEIVVLDPNITACKDKKDLLQQYVDTKAKIDFSQGVDIRLINGNDIDSLNKMRLKELHFAWDNPKDDLKDKFKVYAKNAKHKFHGFFGTVYVLVNFDSTMEENLYRVYTLRDLGFDPFVMIYRKPSAPPEIKKLQRWVNNKIIFRSCARFEDYEKAETYNEGQISLFG